MISYGGVIFDFEFDSFLIKPEIGYRNMLEP